jgi:hypothetical protein
MTRRPFFSIKPITMRSTVSSPPDSSVRIVEGMVANVFSVGRTSRHSGRRRTAPDMTTRSMRLFSSSRSMAAKSPTPTIECSNPSHERSVSFFNAMTSGFSPAARAASAT